jgi:hypothetical protein
MSRSNRYRGLPVVVGLLWLAALWGCAATPLQVVKSEAGGNFRRYTTLVVRDFQNGVGEALPSRVLQEVPDAVVAHLNECYPGAFGKIDRAVSGSADELVVGGTVTEYREGSRFARAMLIGLGSAKFATDVSFIDGQSGRELTQAKVDLLWAMGGLVGASQGIEDLIEKAGRQIADAIAEKKGAVKREEKTQRPVDPQLGRPEPDGTNSKCHAS